MMTPNPNPTRSFDRYTWAVIALVCLTFALTAWISDAVFDRLPHLEDEVAYLFQAEVFARGDIVIDRPVPNTPFWKPFVVDHSSGTRFSKYTPGWSWWLSLGVRLDQAWIINAWFATLSVALIYRLGREIFNRDVGLIAALLVTCSPMALLLNGTLMSHTSALTFVTLFMWAYWRLSRTAASHPLLWGLLAGFALGSLVINRPLSGIAIASPFILWSVIRLGQALIRDRTAFFPILRPLIALSVITLIISAAIPFYNYVATGDPLKNLYTLVWEYDKVGFGPDYGKSGHTLEKGLRHMRFDLSLTAADLFGWQFGAVDTSLQRRLIGEIEPGAPPADSFFPNLGVSWILLLPGLLVAWKRNWAWIWVWIVVVWAAALMFPETSRNFALPWTILGGLLLFAPLIPLLRQQDTEAQWTWLLLACAVILVGVHLAYWIGSQRYSTRYYFEAIGVLALISALPLAWLMRQFPTYKTLIYAGLFAVSLWGFVTYSTPRIDALRGFNRITPTLIEQVNARRTTDRPVLVLITAPAVSWRSYGALMIATNPYFDSPIVAAWDTGRSREQLLALFPDREVIEMGATNRQGGDHSWFLADCEGGVSSPQTCTIANPPRMWE
ncbi:MAG: glycosyltransferase family 39 protein [Anaerolineae bacterium]|nr:glycosyltransferase family 39 protein [Anaerolineae bacterium]